MSTLEELELEVENLRATILKVNQIGGIFVCTKAMPWSPVMNLADRQIIHFDAEEVGEHDRECPYCKHRWKVETPQ